MDTKSIIQLYMAISVITIVPIYLITRNIIITDRTNKQRTFVIGALFTPFNFAIIGILTYLYNIETIFFTYFPLLWCLIITFFWMNNQTTTVENEPAQKILSPTFTAKDLKDWRCRTLLVPHEVIRDGLNTIIDVINPKYYQSTDINILNKKMNTFFTWYNKHYICIFNHHRDEEDTYFPWLESQTEELPSKISDDHKTMNGVLDKIGESEEKFKLVCHKNDFMNLLTELNELCAELRDDMDAHLNEEEETIPGLLRKYNVNKDDEDAIVRKIVENLGFSGNKIFLPWIIDVMYNWGGQYVVTDFMSTIPAPILFINYIFWIPHYNKYNKKIVQEIIS